jgi:hypothetical protein
MPPVHARCSVSGGMPTMALKELEIVHGAAG